MILKLNSFWLAWMFYKCRITKCIEVAPTNFLGTHPACSWPLWTLSMCSTYFSCHWAAMSCLKRKCFAKGNIRHQDCLPAWFCQDKFVEDGEDEAVQQDGVEEDHQSGCFVAHDEANERQNYLTIIISITEGRKRFLATFSKTDSWPYFLCFSCLLKFEKGSNFLS